MKLVHWLVMIDGWAVTFGTTRRGPSSPLFAVPNVTAHPSIASRIAVQL